MDELGYAAFDADNHYYEAIDAFTRHLDPRLGPRCVQWAEIDGRRYHVVGGRVSRAVVNPTFDPIAKAGALHDYFRGNPEGRNPLEFLREREPIRPEYRDRDARLAVMDEFGLDGVWMFPTLGVLYEELLKHDPEAVSLTFTAFNRWLDEDWGLNYRDRILAIERAAYDFLLSLTFDGLFDRFPNLRVASVENGSEFLPDLLKKLASTHRKMPGIFRGDPVEAFRRNVWINPFWEDDPYEIVELMGDDRVIFGSDWPHIEGMPRPLDYVPELKELDDEPRRRVMRENALELTARRPL